MAVALAPSPNWYGAHTADWAPGQGLYAYGAQNTVVLLNTQACVVRTLLSGHTNRVTAVVFAGAAAAGASCAAASAGQEPLLVTAAADRTLRLWNLDTLRRLRVIYNRPAETSALAVSSDGTIVLIGDKAGNLFSWDLSDPTAKPRKLPGCKQAAAVTCLAAAPAGSATSTGPSSSGSSLLLAGYADGSVLLLDWRQDRLAQRLERHARELQCVRWFAAVEAPPPAAAAASAVAAAVLEAAVTEGEGAAAAGAAAGAAGAAAGAAGDADADQQQQQARPPVAGSEEAEADVPPPPPPEGAEPAPAAPLPAPVPAPAPAAAPAWEVLLSSGADGALRLYSLPAPSSSTAITPVPVTTLRLPKPPGNLTGSQSSRLWFTAAVVPPPLQPQQPPPPQQQQHVWLATTGHGGSLLAWQVPLPAPGAAVAAPAAAAPAPAQGSWRRPQQPAAAGSGPTAAIVPCRLPVTHGRTVFTLHAASLSDGGGDASAIAGGAAAAAAETLETASGGEEQPQAGQQAPQLLQLMSSSMDRAVMLTQLPHPVAAVEAAVSAAAPEGSWRRDSAAGSAADAAWTQAAVAWRLVGLGGHVYGLSLLFPPEQQQHAVAEDAGEEVQQQPEVAIKQAAAADTAGAGADAEPAAGCGESIAAENDEEVPPPPPPLPPAEPHAPAAGMQPDEQQNGEQLPQRQVHTQQGKQQQEKQQKAEPQLLPLLAVACGDKSIRVLPVRAAAAAQRSGGKQPPPQQLLLWQNIPEKVTAVAWQPLLPAVAGSTATEEQQQGQLGQQQPAPSAAVAAAALAFGCEDGSLGLMLPSREKSLLLPVKHKGALVDVRWVPAPSASGAAAAAALQLYSLSADGILLLWGPLPLPLSDLFASTKAGGGGGSSSWAAPGGRVAAALSSPVDVAARLSAMTGEGLGPAQQSLSVTAFAVLPPASLDAPAAEGTCRNLLAVALKGGATAVLQLRHPAAAGAAAGSEAPMQLLWSTDGSSAGGANISHLCFSADGSELATAAESGLVSVHHWAADSQAQEGPAAMGHAAASSQLDSAVTALAWVGGGSGGGGGGAGASSSSSPSMLAAALLSGGIQLMDSTGSGSLVPTALLRGHSGIVRCLASPPPVPQPPLQQQEQQAADVVASPANQQESGEQPGDAEQPAGLEHQQAGQEQEQQQPKLLLLSGAEDQSLRVWDVQRQLLVWKQRQEEAAAAEQAAAAAAAAAAGHAAAAQQAAAAATSAEQDKQQLPDEVASAESDQPAEQVQQAAERAQQAPASVDPAVAGQAVATMPLAPLVAAAPGLASSGSGGAAVAAHAAAAPGTGKKKAAPSALANRSILPAALIGDADRQQQQEAQHACLRLAQQLAHGRQQPAIGSSTGSGEAGAELAPPPPPPPPPLPPSPAAALLLDCAAEPLSASLVLQQQAAALGAAAGSATSAAIRLPLAQRAAAAALLRGDVGAAMQLLLDHDALTADFVSMSAAAGPAAWRAMTRAYAAKLEQQQGEPQLAALHLLAAQEVEAAVQVYRRAGLLRDGLALASARLLPGHPLLQEMHAAYAAQLSGKGQHEQAAAHHLAAGQWGTAAAALGSRPTAAAAAAAVEVCHLALSCQGPELAGQEEGRLRQQLADARQLLAQQAITEGVDAAAVAAAAAAAAAPAVAMVPAELPVAGSDSIPPPPPAAGAARQQRQRYTFGQMLALGGTVPPGSGLPDLPEDLARDGAASHTAGVPGSSSSSSSSRKRYSLQALLELSVSNEQPGPGPQQLRQQLPPDLLQAE